MNQPKFSLDDKILIVHADDAGLSHSENRATIAALKNGIVTSCSIMFPCPWHYEMAQFAIRNPAFDYGVHLTLTCEWENYKFGPVLPVQEVESLVDNEGHFLPKRHLLASQADPDHVRKELTAQIEKAIKFGINPSHLDSHMYSVGASPEFFKIYKELGKKYQLPIQINSELLDMVGLDPSENMNSGEQTVDHVHIGKWEDYEKGQLAEFYRRSIEEIKTGINVILIHPAFDDDEMKGITINHPNFGSSWRQIDLEVFGNQDLKHVLREKGIHLATWKEVDFLINS